MRKYPPLGLALFVMTLPARIFHTLFTVCPIYPIHPSVISVALFLVNAHSFRTGWHRICSYLPLSVCSCWIW